MSGFDGLGGFWGTSCGRACEGIWGRVDCGGGCCGAEICVVAGCSTAAVAVAGGGLWIGWGAEWPERLEGRLGGCRRSPTKGHEFTRRSPGLHSSERLDGEGGHKARPYGSMVWREVRCGWFASSFAAYQFGSWVTSSNFWPQRTMRVAPDSIAPTSKLSRPSTYLSTDASQ